MRVIHRVHSNATNRRTNTAPTLSTGLAEFAQAILFIADRTDRGAAFNENAAHFTGTQTDLSVFAFTSNQLTERTGSTNELSTLTRKQFDAVNRRTHGNVAQRKRITSLDRGFRTVKDFLADRHALRGNDVAAFAVGVKHESDIGGTVRIVFNAFNAGGDTVLITLEVDDAIGTLGTTTLMTAGDVTIVIAAAAAILLLNKSGPGLALVELLVDNLDRMTAAGRRRLEFDESHYITSCSNLIS